MPWKLFAENWTKLLEEPKKHFNAEEHQVVIFSCSLVIMEKGFLVPSLQSSNLYFSLFKEMVWLNVYATWIQHWHLFAYGLFFSHSNMTSFDQGDAIRVSTMFNGKKIYTLCDTAPKWCQTVFRLYTLSISSLNWLKMVEFFHPICSPWSQQSDRVTV